MMKYVDLDLVYPVGSIYLSATAANPNVLFGGQWEQIKDCFLLGAGDAYVLGTTGGAVSHQHRYGLQYGGYYRALSMEMNANAGLLDYDTNGNTALSTETKISSVEAPVNTANLNDKTFGDVSMSHYQHVASTSAESNFPPYLTVQVWKRVA